MALEVNFYDHIWPKPTKLHMLGGVRNKVFNQVYLNLMIDGKIY